MTTLGVVVRLYFIRKTTAQLLTDMSGRGVFIIDSEKNFFHAVLFGNSQSLLQYFRTVSLALFGHAHRIPDTAYVGHYFRRKFCPKLKLAYKFPAVNRPEVKAYGLNFSCLLFVVKTFSSVEPIIIYQLRVGWSEIDNVIIIQFLTVCLVPADIFGTAFY